MVIFEAIPAEDQWDNYLEMAEMLKPELTKIKGFIQKTKVVLEGSGNHEISRTELSYQMSILLGRYILSPSFTPKVS